MNGIVLWWRQRQLRSKRASARRTALSKLAEVRSPATLTALLGGLNDADATVREVAALGLATLNDSRGVEPLIKALRDPDERVLQAAVAALDALRRKPMPDANRAAIAVALEQWEEAAHLGDAAVTPLATVLRAPAPEDRRAAVGALGRIGSNRAITLLVQALGDADAGVRAAIVEGLSGRAGANVVEAVLRMVQDPDPYVQRAALGAAGRTGDPRAIALLADALHHPELHTAATAGLDALSATELPPHLRAQVSVALRRWEDLASLGADAVEPLLPVLNDPDPATREAATIALGDIGDARALSGLIGALSDAAESVRRMAAHAVAHLGRADAVEPLCQLLARERVAAVRQAAVLALGQTGSSRAVEPIIGCLDDGAIGHSAATALDHLLTANIEVPLRARAAVARHKWSDLAKLGADAVDALLPALTDSATEVRQGVVRTLGEIADLRAVEPLLALRQDPDAEVRAAVASALDTLAVAPFPDPVRARLAVALRRWDDLAALGDAAVEPLVEALTDPDATVCAAAARLLAERGDARAVDYFLASLRDAQWEVREAAAHTLGELGDRRASEALVAALKDPDGDVREAAVLALGRVGDTGAVGPLLRVMREGSDLSEPATDAVAALMRRPLADRDRARIAVSLGQWPEAALLGTAAIDAVTEALADPAALVRCGASATLAAIGDVSAIPVLVPLLADPEHAVQIAALDALNVLKWEPKETAHLARVAVLRREWHRVVQYGAAAATLLGGALHDVDCSVRRTAARLLGDIGAPDAVDALLPLLTDADWMVRVAAAEALGRLRDPRTVASLTTALHDADAEVRAAAVDALGGIGDDAATAAICDLLADENADVRAAAIRALAQVNAKSAVDVLLPFLSDRDWSVRKEAAKALAHFAWKPKTGGHRAVMAVAAAQWSVAVKLGAVALGPLGAALTDDDCRMREGAAVALGKLGNSDAVAVLTAVLNDDVLEVREAARTGVRAMTYQLGDRREDDDEAPPARSERRRHAPERETDEPRSIEPLLIALTAPDSCDRESAAATLGQLAHAAAAPALAKLLHDSDWGVRESAAAAIEAIGWSSVDKAARAHAAVVLHHWDKAVRFGSIAIGPLVAATRDEAADVRTAAAAALGRIGDPRVVPNLVGLLDDRVVTVRAAAASALDALGWPSLDASVRARGAVAQRNWGAAVRLGVAAIVPLVAVLRQGDAESRIGAAGALARIGDECAVQPLIVALSDRRTAVRQAAADALGLLGDEAAAGPLAAALNDADGDVRMAAADALGALRYGSAIEPLIFALRDQEWEVRVAAAEALAAIADLRVVTPLQTALKDNDWRVRLAAVEGLDEVGPDQAVAALVAVANDENSEVRAATAAALSRVRYREARSAAVVAAP